MAGYFNAKIIYRYLLFLLLVTGVLCCSDRKQFGAIASGEAARKISWNTAAAILDSIKPPVFPSVTFSIKDFGAMAGGLTDCTDAINKAILACHNDSGGNVIIPEGKYLTGAVHLKSNVNLHLEKGAVLIFTGDRKKYLPLVHTRFEGMECMNYSPFVYAYKQKNIAITGEGTLDGQGQLWWSWKGPWGGQVDHNWQNGMPDQSDANKKLQQMVEENLPYQQRIFGEGYNLRPNFIQPFMCQQVLIEGITIINSPMWVIHPVLCNNVTVQNITIESLGPNNDGCDPECSRNVLIRNCYFNTGDDCIAIKSGRNNDGRRINIPSENIIIQKCTMKEGHGGIVIGSEISGNVRNIFAEDCFMDSPNLERVLRIKSNSLRGGVVENVFLRNMKVKQVGEAAILIDLFYSKEAGNNIPVVRNISVDRLTCGKSQYAILIKAYKEQPVTGLSITNSTFRNVLKGIKMENTAPVNFENSFIYDNNGNLLKAF
jgi:polygalacturonase